MLWRLLTGFFVAGMRGIPIPVANIMGFNSQMVFGSLRRHGRRPAFLRDLPC